MTTSITPEFIRDAIERVGTGIKPDEDWMPCLVFENEEGAVTIMGMPVPMRDELERNIVARIIVRTLKEMKAVSACWIVTAWSIQLNTLTATKAEQKKAMADANAHKIHERPDKVEIVAATIAHRDSDKMLPLIGEIIRSDEHPKVRWRFGEIEKADGMSGRFPDALREGLAWQ